MIMINGMDAEYVSVCVNYIKEWIAAYGVQSWGITQENIEYIIAKGGNGIRDLEENFHKLIKVAREEKLTKIDKAFIDKVFS